MPATLAEEPVGAAVATYWRCSIAGSQLLRPRPQAQPFKVDSTTSPTVVTPPTVRSRSITSRTCWAIWNSAPSMTAISAARAHAPTRASCATTAGCGEFAWRRSGVRCASYPSRQRWPSSAQQDSTRRPCGAALGFVMIRENTIAVQGGLHVSQDQHAGGIACIAMHESEVAGN